MPAFGGWTRTATAIFLAFLGVLPDVSLSLPATRSVGSRGDRQEAPAQVAINKELARRFLRAIPAKNTQLMRSVLAPDARLILRIAGVYSPELRAFPQGTQWSREALIRMEVDFQKDLAGPFSLQILSIIGEGDLVAAEVVGQGVRASTGRQYLQHYSYHFHISHGLIAEIGLYQDTFHYWDVWDNPSVPARWPVSPPSAGTGGDIAPDNEPAASAVGKDQGLDRVASNKEAVRRFLVAFTTKDLDTLRTVWVPGAVWSFAVGGSYSPTLHAFQGAPRWERDAMIGMQQSGQVGLKEPVTLDVYSLIGEGDEVSAEVVGFLVRPNGRAYRQHYSLHFKARAGRLIEGHVYQDTLHQYDLGLDHDPYAPVAVPISIQ